MYSKKNVFKNSVMVSDVGIEASQRLIMDPYIVLNLKLPYAQSLYNLERKL